MHTKTIVNIKTGTDKRDKPNSAIGGNQTMLSAWNENR